MRHYTSRLASIKRRMSGQRFQIGASHRRIPKGGIENFLQAILQIVGMRQARFYRDDDAIMRAATVPLLPFNSNSRRGASGNCGPTNA